MRVVLALVIRIAVGEVDMRGLGMDIMMGRGV